MYIGESTDIYKRWNSHIRNQKNKSHHSYKLQKDWNLYGEQNFKFKIILFMDDKFSEDEYYTKPILRLYENKFILSLKTHINGYNIESKPTHNDDLMSIYHTQKMVDLQKFLVIL